MADWFDNATTAAPAQSGPVTIQTRGADPKLPLQLQEMQQRLEIERERLRLAQQAAGLSAQANSRAADKDAVEQAQRNARGGVDSTESERTAAYLTTRVAGGLNDLARIGNVGAPSLRDAAIGGTMLGNYTTSEGRQRTINAQRDILDAALTLGTGAAYTQEQIDAYRSAYFPQPGDQPKTVEDKTRRLQTLLSAARLKSGAAAGLIDKAIEDSGAFRGIEAQQTTSLSEDDKAFLSANARTLGENGIRQFLKARGLEDEQGIRDAMAYYNAGGTENARVNYNETPLSQGLSGINEGIASTLGAPVDIANSVLGLGARGINAIAGTDLSVSGNPYLGSEWFRNALSDAGTIGAPSEDPTNQFIRRAGQSVGAAAIPGSATVRTGRQALGMFGSALGGGIGAATAQQVAPGNVWAELGGELIGGGVPALGSLNNVRRTAQQAIDDAVPTIPQLKEQAGNLYRQAEQNGVAASPAQTQQLSDDLASMLRQEGLISPTGRLTETMPSVKEGFALVDDYAKTGSPMTPTQMEPVRRRLAEGLMSQNANERRMAGNLVDQFDAFANPLAPEFGQARDVASRYLTAEQIAKARELADARASQFAGSGLENALRTEFRGLDRAAIKGQNRYSDDVLAAIENVSRGTPLSNLARGAGRMAPTGPVSFGLGTVAPATLGGMVAGPAGAAVAGTAASGLGMFGRKAATALTGRNAELAELIARNGGNLPKPQVLTPELERLIGAGVLGQSTQFLQ